MPFHNNGWGSGVIQSMPTHTPPTVEWVVDQIEVACYSHLQFLPCPWVGGWVGCRWRWHFPLPTSYANPLSLSLYTHTFPTLFTCLPLHTPHTCHHPPPSLPPLCMHCGGNDSGVAGWVSCTTTSLDLTRLCCL